MATEEPTWRQDRSTANRRRFEIGFFIAGTIFAFFYYRDAYRLGFDWGDMGSYALYVHELMQGAKFGDAVGYGPLWYFLGVGVFRIWGVDFDALLAVLQVIIFASAVLIWLAVRKATGSVTAATVVFGCILCVPPFHASTMRMVSLALFAYPLICLAKARPGRELRHLIATSAAIGVNFAMRPDFGYLYSAALGILLLLRACQQQDEQAPKRGQAGRVASLSRNIFISAATILLTLTPVIIHAAMTGYLPALLTDLLSYPARLLFFLRKAGGVGDLVQQTTTTASFLRILPVSALVTGSVPEKVFAFLIHSTIVVMALYGMVLLHRLVFVRPFAAMETQLGLAVLMIAAIQWPGFALFRPDWIHFISFMHGYLILAGCLVVWLAHGWRGRSIIAKAIRTAGLAVLAAQMGLFVGYGVFVDPNGWGAKQARRGAVFSARNGIAQFVSPDEKELFDNIATLIEHSSKEGDRIVCVPYCAGFAFMTGRRILFKEHYVDDGTPLLYPGWVDRAVALTRDAKPPVVIVLDWAPNGSQASRFDHWASRYMDYIRQTYPRSVPIGIGTAWLRDPGPVISNRVETVLAYGPASTRQGALFNVQASGESALWMKLSAAAGVGASVMLDDQPLKTVVNGAVVTALVPTHQLSKPGRRWLKVTNPATGLTTTPVPFDIVATLP
ncbi:hypothetical protein [Bosea sp. UNC402CLCol]|uniref:hypothetical protein n=1 Tax=Bosea sp. UNC402CLCol TaxID=1510531 RepID=UPI00056FD84C|nr:hypothetical protein [Bosea sp. UNC402CLCol]